MTKLTFITGNQKKADYLAEYLGFPVEHIKIDLDELQSLDLQEVVKHKVRQAYEKMHAPVLVEDVGLEFHALGRLPGTFIKWFMEELSLEGLCGLVGEDRSATARCMFGYYDGSEERYLEGSIEGTIAQTPKGTGGYGWDSIFIPNGGTKTGAELSEAEYRNYYLAVKPFEQFSAFIAEKK